MLEFIARETIDWLRSPGRAAQISAARYLAGQHDILTRQRSVIGRDGRLETARNLPNNRLVDNQYGKLVRQKVNYLVGRPFTFSGDTEYVQVLDCFFTQRRRKTIRSVCEDAVGAGIGWILPCVDERGNFLLKRIPPYEILPFWADGEHTVLDCAVRVYERDAQGVFSPLDSTGHAVLSGSRSKHIEIYTKEGISRYVLKGDKLIPDGALPSGAWLTISGRPWNWGRVPLVAFKSPGEESLLARVKTLQDALNTLLSDFQNSLQEDARNTILVLKNYDGADLAEFRHNLAAFGAVKVKTVDSTPGGVETLRIEVNHESYEALASMLKQAIVENGMGFDMRNEMSGRSPNQMALLSMYSDIELESHALECEWKASFEELLGFVGTLLALTGKPLTKQGVDVVFNRDMLMNESDIMKTLLAAGLKISNRSLLEQVPWVKDAEVEIERLMQERG